MGEKLKPPVLRVVEKTETIPKPIDIEERLTAVLPECLAKIEAMDYVGAFQHFAEHLGPIERTLGSSFFDEPIQKPLRRQLKQLWGSFLEDTKDRKKLDARLRALSGQTKKALEEITIADENRRVKYDALPDERKNYLKALVRQEVERSTVVTFPNAESLKAGLGRLFDEWLRDSIEKPIEEAYAPELKHIGYIDELFNNTLPFLTRRMEGYVHPLIEGRQGYSNYVPVTAAIIQADIVAFLKQAPKLVETFAEIVEERDSANESIRRLLKG